MTSENGISRLYIFIIIIPVLLLGVYAAQIIKNISETIHDLLAENKELKAIITRLTEERQIGYSKVVKQENINGKTMTTLKFIETARDDPGVKILEKEYTIEGDVVHFDALIVKFDNTMVMDGRERALYLWRRIYGENMSPSDGFVIEEKGSEPERYRELLGDHSLWDKLTFKRDVTGRFWDEIWNLTEDPDKLKKYGISAVYGNVVYSKLRPGLIYIFKITDTGQLYPETVPDM